VGKNTKKAELKGLKLKVEKLTGRTGQELLQSALRETRQQSGYLLRWRGSFRNRI
jgi:hypothetical protein